MHENTLLVTLSEAEKAKVAAFLGTYPRTLEEWRALMSAMGLVGIQVEDWSGMANILKLRMDRRVTRVGNLFTWRERLSVILPREVKRFGWPGLIHVMRTEKEVRSCYRRGFLRYKLYLRVKPDGGGAEIPSDDGHEQGE